MRSLTDMAGDLNTSTAQVLTALRIVATRGRVEELAAWATKETVGYDERDELPPHRVWKATIVGNLYNPAQAFMREAHLGDFAIDEKLREKATTFECRQGVGVIEASLEDDTDGDGTFAIELPNLAMLINTGPMRSKAWTCTHASARFSKARLQEVVNRARQTALGLCLQCEEQGIELHWSEGNDTTREERAKWRDTLREEGTRVALKAAWETFQKVFMGV